MSLQSFSEYLAPRGRRPVAGARRPRSNPQRERAPAERLHLHPQGRVPRAQSRRDPTGLSLAWLVPFCIICLLNSLGCIAGEPPIKGVWEGTIGDHEVVACFDSSPPGGSYYYQRFLTPIRLRRTAGDTFWHEEGETGRWTLEAPVNDTISGTWRSIKGRTSLGINLRLIGCRPCFQSRERPRCAGL